MQSQRELLDALMGKDRNHTQEERSSRPKIKWDNREVCQFHNVSSFCPYSLFRNTTSDLGFCKKEHHDKYQEEFRTQRDKTQRREERDILSQLESFVRKIDFKIDRNRSRLDTDTKPLSPTDAAILKDLKEKIQKTTDNIKEILTQAEKLKEEGKDEEGAALVALTEDMKKEQVNHVQAAENIERSVRSEASSLCEICGAMNGPSSDQSRIESHLAGKQHTGWMKIRNEVKRLEEKLATAPEKGGDDDVAEKEDGERSNRRERRRERSRSGSRSRHSSRRKRSRSRDRRDRDRDRDRRRDRHGRDSRRDRDRRRRSRSRDRRRRSRSRDRSRRDRRRSRSRSRDRKRSSRRDRSRSKSPSRKNKNKYKSRSRSRSRSKDKSKSRSRSRSKSPRKEEKKEE